MAVFQIGEAFSLYRADPGIAKSGWINGAVKVEPAEIVIRVHGDQNHNLISFINEYGVAGRYYRTTSVQSLYLSSEPHVRSRLHLFSIRQINQLTGNRKRG